MLRRPNEDDAASVGQGRRQAMDKLEDDTRRLGGYAVLNYLAPLARLCAICSLLFGSNVSFRRVVGPQLAVILTGIARGQLFKAGGNLALSLGFGGSSDDDAESSAFHQWRLVIAQTLRAGLTWVMVGVSLIYFDSSQSGLSVPIHSSEVFAGVGVGCAMFALWSIVHMSSPREQLTITGGPFDLSSATEDELLRVMRLRMRAVSMLARCVAIVAETGADALLIFLFLPSMLEGNDEPSPVRPFTPSSPHSTRSLAFGSSLVSAIVYGSQHLRFRGEWALCSILGFSLVCLTNYFDGRMWATLLAAVIFATVRHVKRAGLDVRPVHRQ